MRSPKENEHRAEKWTRFSALNDAPTKGNEHRIDPKTGLTFGSDALAVLAAMLATVAPSMAGETVIRSSAFLEEQRSRAHFEQEILFRKWRETAVRAQESICHRSCRDTASTLPSQPGDPFAALPDWTAEPASAADVTEPTAGAGRDRAVPLLIFDLKSRRLRIRLAEVD